MDTKLRIKSSGREKMDTKRLVYDKILVIIRYDLNNLGGRYIAVAYMSVTHNISPSRLTTG